MGSLILPDASGTRQIETGRAQPMIISGGII